MPILPKGDSALGFKEKAHLAVTSQIFLRGMGLVYLAAFASLFFQIEGLIGSQGVSPAQDFLSYVKFRMPEHSFAMFPTLFWLHTSDFALRFVCASGVVASLFIAMGMWQLPSLFAAWVFYLSLVHVSQDFLSFQWDILLLEAGFISIFVAPFSRFWSKPTHPSPWAWFLIRWVLFRLMFESGLAKLLSGDPAWRNLTALTYHYETQPLPTPVAWYFHHLPEGFHALSAVVMFFVELGAPFFIFAGRRLRKIALVAIVGLQLLIAVTGNYAFFNLLTLVLCISILDDDMLPSSWVRGYFAPCQWPRSPIVFLSVVLVAVSLVPLSHLFRAPIRGPSWFLTLTESLSRVGLANQYGLFAVMTTMRPQIQVEGSDDGDTWKEYEFRYQPGDQALGPTFVAPHQPRLDWQMWFAALSTCNDTHWFRRFTQRLLEGSPTVLDLLKTNPFPSHPPKYVRSTLWDYSFSSQGQAQWWNRVQLGPYCAPMTRKETQP